MMKSDPDKANSKMKILDKIGSVGALLSAAACPACFPLFAIVGSALGLGALRPFEGYAMYAMQAFVLLALLGNIIAYRAHRRRGPLLLGVLSPLLVFFAYHVMFSPPLIYVGLFGLLGAAVWNFIENKRCVHCGTEKSVAVILKSVIACPNCGFQKEETMPTDACQFYYECVGCKTLLKPKQGDCCVFCSYGTVKCPSIQQQRDCCKT